jgi:hypothetical protein
VYGFRKRANFSKLWNVGLVCHVGLVHRIIVACSTEFVGMVVHRTTEPCIPVQRTSMTHQTSLSNCNNNFTSASDSPTVTFGDLGYKSPSSSPLHDQLLPHLKNTLMWIMSSHPPPPRFLRFLEGLREDLRAFE